MENIIFGVLGVLLIIDSIILFVYYRQMKKVENLSDQRIELYKKIVLECRDYCEKQSKEYQNFLKSILEKSEEIKNSDEYKEYLEFKKSKTTKSQKSTKPTKSFRTTKSTKTKNQEDKQEGSENE